MTVLDSWLAEYLATQHLAQSGQAKDTVAISDSPLFSLLLRELTCWPFLPNLSGATHNPPATIKLGIPSPPTHRPCPLGRQAAVAYSAPACF